MDQGRLQAEPHHLDAPSGPGSHDGQPTWFERDPSVIIVDALFTALALAATGWAIYGHVLPRLLS